MGKWAETEEAYFGGSDTEEGEEIMKGRVLPILFNTDMVSAILDGRKTVTRRLVKKRQCMLADRKEPHELDRKYAPFDGMTDAELVMCTYRPPYQAGSTLYVRETWCNANREGADPEYYYFADTRLCEDYESAEWKWRPSIHMPKQAARIWIKVTDVRVERLQDMNTGDFLAEGVVIRPEAFNDPGNAYWQAREKFVHIWDATIKKAEKDRYGWDANPWVWVIEFERCKKPVEE